jgi:hypothetical protein
MKHATAFELIFVARPEIRGGWLGILLRVWILQIMTNINTMASSMMASE